MFKKVLLSFLFAMPLSVFAGPEKVHIDVVPDLPVVITADYTDANSTVWKAPWFGYHLMVHNNSSQPVTIVNLHAKVTATDGTHFIHHVQSVPSIYNFNLVCGSNSVPVVYSSFGTIAPGASSYLQLTIDPSHDPVSQICPGVDPNVPNPMIIVPDNSSVGPTYNYSVLLKVVGWFGTLNSPSAKFEKIVTFKTQ